MSIDTPFRPSIDTTTDLSIDDPSSELYREDLSDRVVVSPSLRFPHTSNLFGSDTRPVSIDGEVVASINVGLLMSFDGIWSVSTDGIRLVSTDAVSAALIDFISKLQPSLRSFYVLMIIQYLIVRAELHTSISWNWRFSFKYSAWNHKLHRIMDPLHSFVKPSSFFCAYKWSQMFGVSIALGLRLVHSFLSLFQLDYVSWQFIQPWVSIDAIGWLSIDDGVWV
ncbi:hypothetical protein F2Q69_00007069 [Brassica cretica]|uniref:Uncharacterized protein n=1 Tax=Brassica cretica TaxID=69181 RepID=A0A8S9PB14_BRACR|nr:hypothetical protein F2Q69_00007069 [Brassica cretica]